jgi:hypothetical protein
MSSDKIWVGVCKVYLRIFVINNKSFVENIQSGIAMVSRITFVIIPVCKYEFYCSNEHEKKDRKSHKKACHDKLKIVSEWKKSKTLDIITDVFKV